MNQTYQVKNVGQNNRGLFAKRPVKIREQIMQCEPFAWATVQSLKANICNWCLLQKQLFKCSQCKSFYYCSQECQKNDWKFHKLQCKIFKKMLIQKNLSVLKALTTQFVFNIRLFLVLNQNKEIAQSFYKMASLEDYQPIQRKQYFQELSLVMMENLQIQKNQENMSNIFKQMNIVAVNAFTIQDLYFTKDGVAIGIFNPANFINHDCSPNCTQIFDGRYLKVISQKQINSGQEITISYTNSLQLYNNRKLFLRQNYLFECFCQLCQIQKMLDVQVRYIHCPQCKELQIRKIKAKDQKEWQHIQEDEEHDKQDRMQEKYSQKRQQKGQNQTQNSKPEKQYFQCQACQTQVSYDFIKELTKAIELLPDQIDKLQYKLAKKRLFEMKKKISIKHPFFCKCLQSLLQKSINFGVAQQNQQDQKKVFEESYILLLQILNNLKHWYRLDEGQQLNMRFWMKYNEMSKLCHTLSKLQKCLNYVQKAVDIIKGIKLRNQYKQIKQMFKRYQQVKIQISIAKSNAFNSVK